MANRFGLQETSTLSTVSASATVPLNFRNIHGSPHAVGVIATSTVNYTVQLTMDDPAEGSYTNWYDHPTLTSKTASAIGTIDGPVSAVKVKVNSVSGGTVKMQVRQVY